MTLRSLLVELDASPANAARSAIAIGLARTHRAHLAGVAPLSGAPVQDVQAAAARDGHVGGASAAILTRAEDLAQEFHLRCEAAGLADFEARPEDTALPQALLRQSPCTDLLVLGQPDPSLPDYRARLAAVEQVLLSSARPVLLIPYTHLDPLRIRRVLVAWDGSRESVRAMTDALPLLRTAERVTLAHWRSQPDALEPQPGLARLSAWLAHHGVHAETRDEVTALPVGDALLNAASDMGTDLIVMGAYGHARWAERLFGGVSRTLLQTMTVPVLMSH